MKLSDFMWLLMMSMGCLMIDGLWIISVIVLVFVLVVVFIVLFRLCYVVLCLFMSVLSDMFFS